MVPTLVVVLVVQQYVHMNIYIKLVIYHMIHACHILLVVQDMGKDFVPTPTTKVILIPVQIYKIYVKHVQIQHMMTVNNIVHQLHNSQMLLLQNMVIMDYL